MLLDWLDTAINYHWDSVSTWPGWETRSQTDPTRYTPIGIINHHTAPPVPYPEDKLLAKCNVTIRPDGHAVILAAGYQYDSGLGSPTILDAVRNDRPLPALDGLTSTVNGNPLFVDIEVQHLGDGSPIPPVQRQALIAVNAAICERMGWNPMTRVIGHREWAPDRKPDPRWDGFDNPMPTIRTDTARLIGDAMSAKDWTRQTWETLVAHGIIQGDPAYYADGRATSSEYVHAENVTIQALAARTGVDRLTVQRLIGAHAVMPGDKDGVHSHDHKVEITGTAV